MSVARVKQSVRLSRASNGMLMTPEEFDAVTRYDDRWSYELIHGVVVVNPIPFEGEVDPNEDLGRWLRNDQESHPDRKALDKTLPERYVATPGNRRRADRVIWARLGRVPDSDADPPTIAVEFVSKRNRDRKRDYDEKRREYREAGVVGYWISDRFRRTTTVCKGDDTRVIGEGETHSTDLLPGFELPLGRLLAIADAWTRRS